ncbi:MAG: nucleoside phosphorylase [Anaerolineae bacterium]|nr:nucleoside phosphorylase [Anaerolineae bacterium]
MDQPYPILEFDPTPLAVIEPSLIAKPIAIAEHCVVCFFREVIESLVVSGQARIVDERRSEIGSHPVYETQLHGKPLIFFHPGVGAPLAGALLEEVIARGGRKFVACGGAGVLDRNVAVGHLIVPTSAVRDEGLSYHYLPPGREVDASPAGVAAIERVLQAHEVHYRLAKTWTTDAIFRETPGKVQRRREEGCLTVEMEAAAFFAIAIFRGVAFAQILYGGDDVSGDAWDHRDWDSRTSIREQLFWLAAEACLAIS